MIKRFRAKKNVYLVESKKKTRSVWHPQIKVEGKWCYLPDDSTPSKLVESPDETTATELSIKALREYDTNLSGLSAEKGADK